MGAMLFQVWFARILFLFCSLALAACDREISSIPEEDVYSGRSSREEIDFKDRQAAFLNQIRAADPQHQTIEKALLNERNELGVILNRNVEMDSIPRLMKSMLAEMAQHFPGQDLTIIAYAASDPPLKIGTARLDAKSRNMSYTQEYR
jgi:hypothetical protein